MHVMIFWEKIIKTPERGDYIFKKQNSERLIKWTNYAPSELNIQLRN